MIEYIIKGSCRAVEYTLSSMFYWTVALGVLLLFALPVVSAITALILILCLTDLHLVLKIASFILIPIGIGGSIGIFSWFDERWG